MTHLIILLCSKEELRGVNEVNLHHKLDLHCFNEENFTQRHLAVKTAGNCLTVRINWKLFREF